MSDYAKGYQAAMDDVVELLRVYGETNMEICSDNILMDPLLRGEQFSEANMKLSRDCLINSTIHSAQYLAAEHLLEQIAALKARTMS